MEYLDVLNENGEFLGKKRSRRDCHNLGLWHRVTYGFLFNEYGDVLLQKRSTNKKSWPDLWDVSVSGHISAGEYGKNALKREIEEEIGLIVNINQLEYFASSKSHQVVGKKINNHFNDCYIINVDIDIDDLTPLKEEISELKWFTKNQVIRRIHNNFNGLTPKEGYWNFLLQIYKIKKFKKRPSKTTSKYKKRNYNKKNSFRSKNNTNYKFDNKTSSNYKKSKNYKTKTYIKKSQNY